MITYRSVLLNS